MSGSRIVLILVLAALLILAWMNRFIQDDAFISFRYAYNLAHGQGLVWNPGDRIEGYTNFLWTLLMSAGLYFGRDPVRFSFVVGMFCFLGSLLSTYKIGELLLGKNASLVAVTLLGTNYTFSSYATSGLETQLQTCLVTVCILFVVQCVHDDNLPPSRLLLLSTCAGLSVLTRPDSPLLISVPLVFTFVELLRRRNTYGIACLISPFNLLVGAWIIWKLLYYGELLPNTFHAKVLPSRAIFMHGLLYLYLFLESYWLIPILILILFFLKRVIADRVLLMLALTILLWFGYTVFVGGDFMEFRFLVPVLPAIFILIAWMLFVQIRMRALTAGLCVVILLGSFHHAVIFNGWAGIVSFKGLADYVGETSDSWVGIGKMLGQALNYDPEVTVAITAAGAIPYYSRLTTVDMFGLSDRWVVRNGVSFNVDLPGHQRIATWNYLMQRHVNLIVGHPQIVGNDFDSSTMTDTPDALGYLKIFGANPYQVAHLLKILEVRLDPEHRLFLGYLNRSAKVDEAIKRNNWIEHDFDPMKKEMKRQPAFPGYAMGERIDFLSPASDKYIWYGFAVAGPPYRWTNRPHAAITFHLNEVAAGTLRINLQPFIVPAMQTRQRVAVQLNGRPLTSWDLNDPKIETFEVDLPLEQLSEDNVLTFDLPDAESPLRLGLGADTSLLAIDVKWMEIDKKTR